MKINIKKYVCLAAIALMLVLVLLCEMFKGQIFGSGANSERAYYIATRVLGGIMFLILMFMESLLGLLTINRKGLARAILFTLPCFAIALNNFPIISYFSGNAYIDATPSAILLYALECLAVDLFEEIAFRGFIFTSILRWRKRTTFDLFLAIVLSSAVFGATHILNVFAGASIGSVMLQISYSFLIGGMCAVVLVKTGCLWHCVLIHSVYNFCGGVVPELGGGVIWDTPTVVLTVIVSVAVAVYVVASLIRIKPCEISRFLREENSSDI